MKIKYMGKFNGDMDTLPCTTHQPGSVMFKEPTDSNKLALIVNGMAFIISILFFIPIGMNMNDPLSDIPDMLLGIALNLLVLFPHEFLHAICFKDTAYVYTYFQKGMLFVVGNETMGKSRFVFMSLLPNLIFGVIPYIIYLFVPHLITLGAFSAMAIASGAGDYLNVFNALTQMPKGARTYLYKMNSFWYIPE